MGGQLNLTSSGIVLLAIRARFPTTAGIAVLLTDNALLGISHDNTSLGTLPYNDCEIL